jgi:type I restriction enzyme M protein
MAGWISAYVEIMGVNPHGRFPDRQTRLELRAGVLQDAGLSCFEYVGQLTLLLFLKMADQLSEPPYSRLPIVPPVLGWKALLPLDGAALEDQYRTSLEQLGVKPGMLGVIFKGARCEIHNPALLKQLIVNLLDKVDWLSLPVDGKGTIYEELLARSARESSKGAGQYFAARPVIQALCEVMQPVPSDRICDPAPDILAAEIADDLEAALEQFTKIAAQLARNAG